ncbi:MAG TPA: sigma-70 family RNA polymerase sigma factor [Actinocrinis sp.]
MTDRELVTALKAGDRLAAGQMYDTYGTRLYAYCHELLGDHKVAGDALRDTFIVAVNRVRELRRADEFGSWLYALARTECTRLGISDEIPTDAADAVRGDRLARFALDCYAMLPPESREVLDLAFRHRLVDTDLARVLGVTEAEAGDTVSGAQADMENTLLVVLAARTGDPKCSEAADLGRKFDRLDGKEMDSWLQSVGKHVDRCEVCANTVKNRRPLRLFEELPHSFMPPGVRSRVLESLRDPAGVDFATRIADRAGRFDEDGFPIAGGGVGSTRKWLVPAGIGVGVVALVLIGYAFMSGGSNGTPAASTTQQASISASASATSSGVSALPLPSGPSPSAASSSPSMAQTTSQAQQCQEVSTTTPIPMLSPVNTTVPVQVTVTTTITVSASPSPTTTTTTTVTTSDSPVTSESPYTYNSPYSHQVCQ